METNSNFKEKLMHLIKIKSVDYVATGVPCYIIAEEVSSIDYIERENLTHITLRNHTTFEVNGDVSAKLAKLITLATGGSILTLE